MNDQTPEAMILNIDPSTDVLENHPFDSIHVGDGASLVRLVTNRDIQLFAAVSGDVNPAHVDALYAKSSHFHGIIAHGMLGASLISTVLGTRFPGPGTIYLGQSLRFLKPVRVGDTLTVTATVRSIAPHHRLTLATTCVNQDGETVIDGEAEVMAPIEKLQKILFDIEQSKPSLFVDSLQVTPVASSRVVDDEQPGLLDARFDVFAVEARQKG